MRTDSISHVAVKGEIATFAYGTCREDEKAIFVSQHHTRCEQWSTLREMLPSRGRAEPLKQPNWGTGRGVAPSLVGTRASEFPVYDSEMTRFVQVLYPLRVNLCIYSD